MARTFNQTIKNTWMAMGLGCIALLLTVQTAVADPWSAPIMGDYIKTPPFASYSVKPNIMIVLDNSGSMNSQAYSDGYNGEPYNSVVGTLPVTSDADDMEENLGGVLRDGPAGADDLDMGTDYVGIRFQGVAIPQGYEIEAAYIQFTATGGTAGASDLVIEGEASDDANPMDAATNFHISSRTFTTSSVSWTPGAWTDGQVYNSADITSIIQEIVDRPGWAAGNAMLFNISGSGFPGTATGHRQAHSREAGQTLGPVLRVLVKQLEPSIYYGYYNPEYFYNHSSNVFYPQYKKVSYNFVSNSWNVVAVGGGATTIDDSFIVTNGLWDGNWLNWCSMRRVDSLRKVLMGGLATSRVGGGNSRNIGEDPNNWQYYKFFDTSGEGPAVSPYNGNFRYYIEDGSIKPRTVSSTTNLDTLDIVIEKDYSTDPQDFFEGNLAGILQRIGDRARWGNMWFNNGTTKSGGYIQNTIGDGNMTNLITTLQNTAADTWTPLAETFYVAMQNFKQENVAGGLGYPSGSEKNSNLGQDPYYDSGEKEFLECANSFVLMLTDGASTRDGQIPNVYKDYDNDGNDACSGDCSSDFLDDLALYARTQDLRPGAYTGNVGTGLPGDQNLYLYTVYAFDDDPQARQLLKDASRNGGFEDHNGNNLPDGDIGEPDPSKRLEWDQDGDGDPDNYYEASDGYALSTQLLQAINDILARASSGTAASVVANSRTGEGALFQSIFYPATTVGGDTVKWVGQVQSLMVDKYGNMREDTDNNQSLDTNIDLAISFVDDQTNPVQKYQTPPGYNKRLDPTDAVLTLVDQGPIYDIEFLWDSSSWLNEISDTNVIQQRNYTSTSDRRYIFTFSDVDGDMAVDPGEQVDFSATIDPTWAQVNDANHFSAYIHPYKPYTPPISTAHADFQDLVTRQVARTVNFIRGQDQPMETVGSTFVPAYRSRAIDYDHDGTVETWRLGDIIYSTPMAVSNPAENYDIIWRDSTYVDFFKQYKNRRNVIYVGANDGMVHAFNGGFFDSDSSTFLQRPLDMNGDPDTAYRNFDLGAELWAYVPRNLLPHLHWLTEPQYGHIYYADLQPRIFDAKIFPDDTTHPNGWGTVMVAGMRFGGGRIPADIDKTDGNYNSAVDKSMSSAYAIFDITDPEQEPVLMAEINFPELGFTTCHPGVIPMRDIDTSAGGLDSGNENMWYLIFGSGPIEADGAFTTAMIDATSSQNAVLYAIDLVRLGSSNEVVTLTSTGEKTYPGSGAPYYWTRFSEPESMVSKPIAVDRDRDFNVEVAYFGTYYGNHTDGWGGKLRRIVPDINNKNPWTWENDSTLIELTDIDPSAGGDQGQPVTAPATSGVDGEGNRWVYFGTGRYYALADADNTQQQSFYGIIEPSTVNGTTGELEHTFLDTVDRTDLLDVSDIEVYESGADLTNYSGNFYALETDIRDNYKGWVNDFTFAPDKERNLGQSVLAGELLTFTSYLPSAALCTIGGSSQVYALYYTTGTAYHKSIFGTDGTDVVGGNERVLKQADLGDGLTISPNIHVGSLKGSQAYIQTSTGAVKTLAEENPGEIKSRRLEWAPDLLCP